MNSDYSRRVKATENGTTTTFVGAHYEVTGSTVTKYYFAGMSRIAMGKYTTPEIMKVEYFLSDHLGSTSISTDTAGVKVSEMRYKPFGEVRYAWKNDTLNASPAYALTKYTFTGQYSYMDDPSTPASEGFGLMHYGARMYDPALGRFTSADTIIPQSQGVQAWDRFAYVNNNPVRYTDPTGHYCVQCLILVGVVVFTTAVIYSTPQMQELGHQAAEGLGGFVEMSGRRKAPPFQESIKALTNSNSLFGSEWNLFDFCMKAKKTCFSLVVITVIIPILACAAAVAEAEDCWSVFHPDELSEFDNQTSESPDEPTDVPTIPPVNVPTIPSTNPAPVPPVPPPPTTVPRQTPI